MRVNKMLVAAIFFDMIMNNINTDKQGVSENAVKIWTTC